MKSATGIIFWIAVPIVLLVVVASPFLLPFVNSMADNAAARRDQQAAVRANAEAVKTGAEAQADALLALTAEGVQAIKADRNKAHPFQYLTGLAGQFILVALAVVAFGAVGLAVLAHVNPDAARTLVSALTRRRE